MSRSYQAAIKQYLPEVDIVFDRFHVMQLVTRALDKVRKKQQSKLEKSERKPFRGKRFLLLANYASIGSEGRERLNKLLKINEPLMIMHTMKEQLRLLWSRPSRKAAKSFLLTWILDSLEAVETYKTKTGSAVLKPLRTLAFTMARHMDGILNYFDHGITNGKIEGVNNKIKTLKRQAYGFRDNEYFKLRLFHLHAQKAQLSG